MINIGILEKIHVMIQNFAGISVGFMSITETYKEKIYAKMAFI